MIVKEPTYSIDIVNKFEIPDYIMSWDENHEKVIYKKLISYLITELDIHLFT